MNRRTRISGIAVVAFAVLTVAGCGDDDKDANAGGNAQASSAASAVAPGQGSAAPGDGAQNGDNQNGDNQNGQPDAAAVQGLQTKLDEILTASPVKFSPQSADLTDEGEATLKKVAEAAAAAPAVKLEVGTHAGYPDAAMATELSQKRADAVSKVLTTGGVAADRIMAKAEGSEGVGGDDAKAMTAAIKAAQ
ncbi:OmpA family protein [Amycolatopsis sp. lyj-112]|uniref:OmpA family protein n=1 Tax=Amycolatopsis sp. lyj-112 TaxID=2789288 RepID=UPI0039790B24